ncbi:MAG TPA: YkgJ family cysteine cluster protein [Acidobacteriota bacterium]|nr:YkgJ family cysteine cluster protein [Acidobacteriota bacterium]
MSHHENKRGSGASDKEPRILTVDLQTKFGRVRGNLALPPGEMRLAEFAWNAMVLDEKLIHLAVTSEARQGRQVSCRKGCGACCRQAVPVSPPEAWMLRDLIASFAPDRRATVLQRFAQIRQRLEQEGFGQRSLPTSAGKEQVQALGLDYFRLGLPCPFLEDESCSIHPQRPSSCREYLVTSPAAFCVDPGLNPVRPVPLAAGLTEALSRLTAVLLGGDPQVIPLVLALDWAEDHREEGQLRYDAAALLTLLVQILAIQGRDGDQPSPGLATSGDS